MARRAASWTCRKCKAKHANRRLRKCPSCGTARPAKRKPAHLKALDLSYEDYIKINGGEHCGICGRGPTLNPDGTVKRRLDRDHDHSTGRPRGLLCGGRMGCNRRLGRVDDLEWLESALRYLRRIH